MGRLRPSRTIVGSLWLSILLTAGCAAKIPVAKFNLLADATKEIRAGTADAYGRVGWLQRQYAIASLGAKKATDTSFEAIDLDGTPLDFRPELVKRAAALDVLVSYTEVLHAFATRDFAAEVDEASHKLAGSLTVLNDVAGGEASGVLATVVDAAGREIVECKRVDALGRIMGDAQSSVQLLAELIQRSNDKLAAAATLMQNGALQKLEAAKKSARPAELLALNAGAAGIVGEANAVRSALAVSSQAMAKLPAAHAEIRNDLAQRPTGLQALQALIAEGRRINRFYRSLKD